MQKNKRIRLKGKAISDLNLFIHERDEYRCAGCGEYVPIGIKWHHFPYGIHKEDRKECGCLLCMNCHYEAHHGDVERLKEICKKYLKELYPVYWS